MVIAGGPADNRVTLRFDSATDRYLVSDRAGIVPGEGCEQVRPREIRCAREAAPGLNDRFAARLGPGNDQFSLKMRTRGGTIKGGEGNDLLNSAEHRNVVLGSEGQDVLRGREGNDSLFGDKGHDVLLGGRGNDRLEARNLDHDRAIDCGPGHDVALVDPRTDPSPRSCEIVVRKPRPHESALFVQGGTLVEWRFLGRMDPKGAIAVAGWRFSLG